MEWLCLERSRNQGGPLQPPKTHETWWTSGFLYIKNGEDRWLKLFKHGLTIQNEVLYMIKNYPTTLSMKLRWQQIGIIFTRLKEQFIPASNHCDWPYFFLANWWWTRVLFFESWDCDDGDVSWCNSGYFCGMCTQTHQRSWRVKKPWYVTPCG